MSDASGTGSTGSSDEVATCRVQCVPGGPNLVYGVKSLTKADGTVVENDPAKPVALCACGKSGARPLCDGSHKSKEV